MISAGMETVGRYSVGEFVYTKKLGKNYAPRLARIESSHSLQSNEGQMWLVRERMRSCWTSGQIHRYIERALTTDEIARCRILGLIPREGEQL